MGEGPCGSGVLGRHVLDARSTHAVENGPEQASRVDRYRRAELRIRSWQRGPGHPGVEIDDWMPVYRKWKNVHARYWDSMVAMNTVDAIWWNKERSNIGAIVVALGGLGHVSLQEHTVDKRKQGERSRGRSDLWTRIGTRTHSMEAKFCWHALGRKDPKSRVRSALKAARADAWKLRKGDADFRAGLVFACPYIAESRSISLEKGLKAFLSDDFGVKDVFPRGGLRIDLYPKWGREVQATGGAICPGVTVFHGFVD